MSVVICIIYHCPGKVKKNSAENAQKSGAQVGPGFVYFCLSLVLDQAIAAIVALINHSKGTLIVLIPEQNF